jgi:hypothetical protein
MDGVMCNVHKAVLAMHGRMDLYDQFRTHDMEDVLDMSFTEIWGPVVKAGYEFWCELEPYPWTFDLWAWAHEVGSEVGILSRPLMFEFLDAHEVGYCLQGKMAWLRKCFGRDFYDFIFTTGKSAVSQPGVILVDDDEGYEEDFNARGGRQIVFPQSYNRFSAQRADPMDCVRAQFQQIKDQT